MVVAGSLRGHKSAVKARSLIADDRAASEQSCTSATSALGSSGVMPFAFFPRHANTAHGGTPGYARRTNAGVALEAIPERVAGGRGARTEDHD